jgi:acetyl esterase/lipase
MRRTMRVVLATAVVTAATVGLVGPVPSAGAEGVRYRDEVFTTVETIESDVPYGAAVNYAGAPETLLLDVIEPVGDPDPTNRAAVVWVHGGFFIRGSKTSSGYKEAREQFARAGYVVFSINYRLNPTLPEGLPGVIQTLRLEEYIQEAKDAAEDAQAAVRWVRAHAADYGVNPDKIAISGHSAGGIISQMVGFNSETPGNSGTPGVSSRPDAVVSSAGGSLPVVLADIDPGEPPMLLGHGLMDDIVPYPADLPACAVSLLLGNVCEQVLDPDQAHGQFGYELWRDFLYDRMIQPPAPILRLPLNIQIVGYPPLFP